MLLAVALLASAALADGGAVRASVPIGALRLTVFTAPTPPRIGTLDVSAIVQRADDSAVLDADVVVTVRLAEESAPMTAAATRKAATNKLMYAARFPVARAGTWSIDVAIRAGGVEGATSFEVGIEPAAPAWQTFWPYLALPFVGVALYVANQLLRRR